MAQRLRAGTALAEGLCSVPSTHTRELTKAQNSTSGDLHALSAETLTHVAYVNSHRHTHVDIHVSTERHVRILCQRRNDSDWKMLRCLTHWKIGCQKLWDTAVKSVGLG